MSSQPPIGQISLAIRSAPGVPVIRNVNWGGLKTLYVKEVRRFFKVQLQTVWAPAITFFTSDDELDLAAQSKYYRYLSQHLHGLVILGTNAETLLLTGGAAAPSSSSVARAGAGTGRCSADHTSAASTAITTAPANTTR